MKKVEKMKTLSKNTFVITSILILMVMISSCSTQDTAVPNDDLSKGKTPGTIRIGAVLALTGAASIHGQNEREGLELARKEINSKGGIAGKQVEIIYEDDQTDSAKSVTAIKKLVEVDNINLIIGGTWDFLANADIPVIEEGKAVLLSPSALPDTITQKSGRFFSVHSPIALHSDSMEGWMAKTGVKKVAAIVVNNPWGLAHMAAIEDAAKMQGVDIILEEKLPSFDQNDLSTVLTKVSASGADGLFIAANFDDSALLAKKRSELSIKMPILSGENFYTALATGKIDKKDAEGVYALKFESGQSDFPNRFEKEYGKSPDIYSDTAYDALYAFKAAIEKADSQDPDRIIQSLHEISFDGASGKIFFGDKNYPENKKSVLGTIRDGKWIKDE
ncbi:MAG: ABC transporter substrate-binding protein [Nanoarchaeota archaeon]